MQYPQIQFYKGSLVRLASGKLKQVEDLSSDDFLESARLVSRSSSNCSSCSSTGGSCNCLNNNYNHNTRNTNNTNPHNQHQQQQMMMMVNGQSNSAHQQNFNANNNRLDGSAFSRPTTHNPYSLLSHHQARNLTSSVVDENNNSVFNSPEPTPSFDSPTLDMMEMDDDDDDDDEELDVVSDGEPLHQNGNSRSSQFSQQSSRSSELQLEARLAVDDLYIDSSVVKDFLEVGPTSSTSPSSSTSSLHAIQAQDLPLALNFASISSSPSSSLNHHASQPVAQQNLTVLIKFFLESSRSIVFIEVPIEHPFFVFHRGWSSWNPQRTYDKFGLKCRKLKIGDTCISLIRKQHKQTQQQQQQQESDQCNILFSSIKINE